MKVICHHIARFSGKVDQTFNKRPENSRHEQTKRNQRISPRKQSRTCQEGESFTYYDNTDRKWDALQDGNQKKNPAGTGLEAFR